MSEELKTFQIEKLPNDHKDLSQLFPAHLLLQILNEYDFSSYPEITEILSKVTINDVFEAEKLIEDFVKATSEQAVQEWFHIPYCTDKVCDQTAEIFANKYGNNTPIEMLAYLKIILKLYLKSKYIPFTPEYLEKYKEFIEYNIKTRTDIKETISQTNRDEQIFDFFNEKHQFRKPTVLRISGITEKVSDFLNRYPFEKLILADPNFDYKEYEKDIEDQIKEIDSKYTRENNKKTATFKFGYNGESKEVVLWKDMVTPENIHKLPDIQIVEQGTVVEGTVSKDFFYVLKKKGEKEDNENIFVVDIANHSSDKSYRQFAQETGSQIYGLKNFFIDNVGNAHDGLKPEYNIILEIKDMNLHR